GDRAPARVLRAEDGTVVRRALAFALALGAAVLASAALPAQADTGSLRIRQIDTSAYPNVAVTVSVPGNLSPDSLRVAEDGKAAPIVTVRPLASEGQTFDVVLAIDTSDSVRGAPLAAAVSAAEGFVQQLPAGVGVGVL